MFSLFLFPAFATTQSDTAAYDYLDQLAIKAKTDKSSAFHNYTEIYAKHFDALRNEPIKFLEIGIYKGDSVKLWEAYFPNAELHFMDVSPDAIQYYTPKAKYHFFDQANTQHLNVFTHTVGGNFDIIIDDGGHRMDQQIISFKMLFPQLKSGGMYIIEDLHTSYWKGYGGNGSTSKPQAGNGTAVEFLKNLIEDLNYTGAATECAHWEKTPQNMVEKLNIYQKDIYSIQFYTSVCIITKR